MAFPYSKPFSPLYIPSTSRPPYQSNEQQNVHKMADFLQTLGLRASTLPVPSYSAHFLIANFFSAYIFATTRFRKTAAGLDHNVMPREDLATFGPQAVQKGRITQEQLNELKRQQAAHENAMEHFPVFVAAIVLATAGGVDAATVNKYGLIYTVARAAYVLAYVKITDHNASYARSVLWWVSNVTCIRLLWFAGKAINAARGF